MRFFNQGTAYNRSVLQHIFQIHKVAVVHMLRKIVGVVKMDYTLFVRFDYIPGQKYAACYILAHFARHIVTLNTVNGRVLVGVFLLYFLIITFNKRKYLFISGV